MQEAAAPLARMEWFDSLMKWRSGSFLLGLAIGAVLSFFVQSSLAIVVLTIAFHKAGLFSMAESIMVVYGANLGSSFLTLMLSSGPTGQSMQIAMYQTAYNFVGAIILVPLFYLEVLGGVPLIRAISEWITTDHDGSRHPDRVGESSFQRHSRICLVRLFGAERQASRAILARDAGGAGIQAHVPPRPRGG
jgi:hypothetical protein